jgi:hypothetical protein
MVLGLNLMIMIALAIIFMAVSWFGQYIFIDHPDIDIYVIVCSILSGIFWFLAANGESNGIYSDGMTESSQTMYLVFMIIFIIQMLFAFYRLINAIYDRKSKDHVNMDEIRL